MVIEDLRRQYPLKMPFVAHDDMIEYVATATADEPLAVGPHLAKGQILANEALCCVGQGQTLVHVQDGVPGAIAG